MKINIYQKICLAFLILLVGFWAYLFFSDIKDGQLNYLYSLLFGFIPLIGGIVAMVNSREWGTFKSAVGKAVFFIGLGLFLWGCGEMIWSYYNFVLQVAAPYPSLADFGFAPSIFFYGLGTVYLSLATGAKFGLRDWYAKIFAVIAPVVIFIVSYYILVVFARGGTLLTDTGSPLKVILDLAYPLGDFLSVTLAVVISGLSFKYFGGQFKIDVYSILLGLVIMFIADSIFSYTTTIGTYYNANWGDLLLTCGLFFITYGVLGFHRLPESKS